MGTFVKKDCKLCGSPLLHGIRVRPNEHVVYCVGMNVHGYIEGAGDTFDKAVEQFEKKSKQKQEQLL